jgi:hypothetical protein
MKAKLKRSDLVAVLIGLCVAAVAWAIEQVGCDSSDYHVQTLEINAARKVRITAASWSEVSQPLCSEILDGREVVCERTHIGCISHSTSTSDLRFALLTSDDRDIVALVEQSSPDVVLMLHRFSTGENYPRGSLPSDEWYARMNTILDHLRRGIRRQGLVLRGQVSGSVDMKVR